MSLGHPRPPLSGTGVPLASCREPPARHTESKLTLQQSATPVRAVDLVSVAASCVCAFILVSTCALVLSFSSVRVNLRSYANTPTSTWSSLRANRPNCNLTPNETLTSSHLDFAHNLVKTLDAIRLHVVIFTLFALTSIIEMIVS